MPSSDKNLTYIIDKIDLCYGTEVEITLSMINCFYYTDIFIICLYFTNCKPILSYFINDRLYRINQFKYKLHDQ